MNKVSKIVYFIITVIFFVLSDLFFSEVLIDSRFNFVPNDIIDLVFVQNTGAAFSLLENAPILLSAFAIIAILLIIVYGIRNIEKFSMFACFWTALLISGIGCNLYERLHFGYVRDFLKLNFVEFPVFNISDIFINIGVIALIIIIIKNKYLKK